MYRAKAAKYKLNVMYQTQTYVPDRENWESLAQPPLLALLNAVVKIRKLIVSAGDKRPSARLCLERPASPSTKHQTTSLKQGL